MGTIAGSGKVAPKTTAA